MSKRAASEVSQANGARARSGSEDDSADDDDNDDDFGPMPAQGQTADAMNGGDSAGGGATQQRKKAKKVRKLEHERLYLANLPTAKLYEHSFMHRDVVSHIVVSKSTEFVVTASVDGHVKFWKKMADNIEFVKHFQAHIAAITAFELSPDGRKLVSAGKDRMVKFFDVQSFDIASMITLEFDPTAACWLPSTLRIATQIVVADENSGSLFIFSSEMGGSPVAELKIHSAPVKTLTPNPKFNFVISSDSRGMLEYWDADSYEPPSSSVVSFRFKSETDLYDLAKSKTWAVNTVLSPTGLTFALFSRDKQLRIFDFLSGRLRSKYDESVKAYQVSEVM
jgi:peptidylprolyl isomerase domain and WD repeat-containing protein 1